MVPPAHAGDWLIWGLYAVPLLIVAGAIAVNAIRARRGEPEANDVEPPERETL